MLTLSSYCNCNQINKIKTLIKRNILNINDLIELNSELNFKINPKTVNSENTETNKLLRENMNIFKNVYNNNSNTSDEEINVLNENIYKSLNSNTVEGSINTINKILYSILKHENQTIVIFNKTILLRNLTTTSSIPQSNGQHIKIHNFTKEANWTQFLRSFVLNFFSELGDKSFLCIVVFYNQVSPLFLFVIAVFAELFMNFISVVIGYEMTGKISVKFFKLIGMFVFILFGLITFYEIFYAKEEDEEEEDNKNNTIKFESNETSEDILESPDTNKLTNDQSCSEIQSSEKQANKNILENISTYFKLGFKVFAIIFIAEFGDKSQITTIILTTEYSPIWIFLGTALAHIFGIVISMFIGYLISNKMNLKMANIIGAVAFVVMGIEMGINYYRNPSSVEL